MPYITDIATGKPSIIPQFREITKNFIISTYSSQEAIDTDDGLKWIYDNNLDAGSSYYNTHDNFFVYAANGLKSDFGGNHNYHKRNVYAFTNNCWGGGNSDQFVNNTCVANSDTGGFRSDCSKSPLMTISGNHIYNREGKLDEKMCDTSNKLAGPWPSAQQIVEMGKQVLAVGA